VLLGVGDYLKGKANQITGISIVDREVVFRLTMPFAFFDHRLATSFMSVVPAGSPEDGPPPLGTGAYQIANWDNVKNRATLVLSTSSWRTVSSKSPTGVHLRVFEHEGLAVAALKSGDINWVESTSTIRPALSKETIPRLRLLDFPHTELRLVALNWKAPPFSEPFGPELARALNLSLDRDEIVAALGGGEPVAGPIPVGFLKDTGLSYSSNAAAAVLANVPAKARKLQMLVEPADEARFISEILVRHWNRLGIEVTAVPGQADFFDKIIGGKYQLALAYYGPFVLTPEQYVWLYREAAIPVPNVMHYSNRTFESSFTKFVGLAPGEAQNLAGTELIQALTNIPPVVWVVRPPRFCTTTTGLKVSRSGGLPDFSQVNEF
jgi:ABC-type transport system substrate-binding protein